MKSNIFVEMAFTANNFPEYSEQNLNDAIKYLLDNGAKLEAISKDLELWKTDTFYFLKKELKVLGWIKLSTERIINKTFNHVDILYVLPEYRKTTATYWLIYSVKQLKSPMIADGAIFKDGVELIKSIESRKVNSVKVLNKDTGNISSFKIVNSDDECYLFEKVKLTFGASLLPGSSKIDTYFPLFEEIK